MKLETFFEKFDQFADAPDAVEKMRELVLELSATGRLIPEALGRPVEEDTKLMGTIVKLVMGQAPAGDEYNTEGRGTVFVKVGEFGVLFPREEVWTTNPLKFAKKGDVLVCVVGATVGKLNLAIECAIGRSAAAIRPSAALDTKFLYYSLIPYTLSLRRNSRGSAQGVIGKAELNAVSLWVPSREVQKRIVAKVDELMALCNRLEAQQQERKMRHAALARASLARFADAPTPANLNFIFHKSYAITPADLRKSILTLAVQGKLVPQDPNDGLAEELLETIAKQRAKLGSDSLRKTKPCRQFTSDEAPNDIPETWVWTMLGEVTDIGTGSTPSRTEASFWMGGTIPWITSGSTSRSPITEEDELVTPAAVKAHRLRLYPPGTLLVALYGQGKTRGQVAALEISATINQACAAICPLDGIPPIQRYLKLLLEKQYDEMRSLSAGGAQPNLNVQKIKEVLVPLPPLAEQRRIVAKVEQLMALVDALETQLAASRATAANLLSALVAELTGTPNNGKVSVPSVSTTGRRGRPPKS